MERPSSSLPPQLWVPAHPSVVDAGASRLPAAHTLRPVPPLIRFFELLRTHRTWPIVIGLLGGISALVFSILQEPLYRATTTIEVQAMNDNYLNMRDVNPLATSEASNTDIFLDTQTRILESRSLVGRVVTALHIEDSFEEMAKKPRFSFSALFRKPRKRSASASREEAIDDTLKHLQVNTGHQTRVIDITFEDEDPERSAQFLNKLAQEYKRQAIDERWNSTQETSARLGKQLAELKAGLRASEAQLQAYAEQSGLVFTAEHQSIADEKLKQLQTALSSAQTDRIAKQSQYELLKSGSLDSLPEVLDSTSFRETRSRLTELQRQQAELKSTFKPGFYRVKEIQAQIDLLEQSLRQERDHITERMRKDFEAALRREKLLKASYSEQAALVSNQAGKTIQYDILRREVQGNRELYDALLHKTKEAAVASEMHPSNVHVIDPAEVPLRPYKPQLAANTVVGLFAGSLLGCIIILVRAGTNRSVQKPGDTHVYLDVPELGVIPSVRSDAFRIVPQRANLQAPKARSRGKVISLEGLHDEPGQLPVTALSSKDRKASQGIWQQDASMLADSFRATIASILLDQRSQSPIRSIAITSPSPKDGKTTVVANLAVALAEIHRRVLLIDADMRRPSLHSVLGVDNDWGLSDVLRESTPVRDYPVDKIGRPTSIPGLSILTSGPASGNPVPLLQGPRFEELFRYAREQFDFVLIDTPPVILVPDARLIGKVAGAVILVFRISVTTHERAIKARALLMQDGTVVLGSILNRWEADLELDLHRHYYASA